MDAFDRQEQLVRNYAIDRNYKPMRWWVRMFVNILDAIMMNAHIIYKETFKMNMTATQNPSNQLEQIWQISIYIGVIHKFIEIFLLPPSARPSTSTCLISVLSSRGTSSLEDANVVVLV